MNYACDNDTDSDVRVTAVILTEKRPFDLFKRAFDSVLNQTYKVKEIVIVDVGPDSLLTKTKRDYVESFTDYEISYLIAENTPYSRNKSLQKY